MSPGIFQFVFVLFRLAPLKHAHARIIQKASAANDGHAKLCCIITCGPPTRAMKINIQPSTLRKVFIITNCLSV